MGFLYLIYTCSGKGFIIDWAFRAEKGGDQSRKTGENPDGPDPGPPAYLHRRPARCKMNGRRDWRRRGI